MAYVQKLKKRFDETFSLPQVSELCEPSYCRRNWLTTLENNADIDNCAWLSLAIFENTIIALVISLIVKKHDELYLFYA